MKSSDAALSLQQTSVSLLFAAYVPAADRLKRASPANLLQHHSTKRVSKSKHRRSKQKIPALCGSKTFRATAVSEELKEAVIYFHAKVSYAWKQE